MDIRKYIDIVSDNIVPETGTQKGARARALVQEAVERLFLREGEMIPFPERVLRIGGAPHDMYQITKMMANPNLAHKVNFTFSGAGSAGKSGANPSEMIIVFYDDVSYEEIKKMCDTFNIDYTEAAELGSEMGRQAGKKFVSKVNPPDEGDELHGQYFKPNKNPIKK